MVEIKRETITKVIYDKDKEIKIGDRCEFVSRGLCLTGRFDGITNRGDLKFVAGEGDAKISFNVKPSSIVSVKVVTDGI